MLVRQFYAKHNTFPLSLCDLKLLVLILERDLCMAQGWSLHICTYQETDGLFHACICLKKTLEALTFMKCVPMI
jgi:hypothetical protein